MLPNLLVIGAQKAGTTSLHRYLDLHPEVQMSSRKELDFFAGPGWNWDRGLAWYASWFEGPERIHGEASPSYTAYPYVRDVPERIKAVVPEAKLVYVVRDPIERMISAYVHRVSRGNERRPIDDAFSDPRFHGSGYVAQSSYHLQLSRYLEHFPVEQVMVISGEDLMTRREEALVRLFRFLGVDDSFRSPEFARTYNPPLDYPLQRAVRRFLPARAAAAVMRGPLRRLDVGLRNRADRPALDPGLRDRVAELVREDVDRLRAATGQRFESWSV